MKYVAFCADDGLDVITESFRNDYERLVWPQGDSQCQQVNDEQDARGDGETPHGIARRGTWKDT
jgi:hypothetical protein